LDVCDGVFWFLVFGVCPFLAFLKNQNLRLAEKLLSQTAHIVQITRKVLMFLISLPNSLILSNYFQQRYVL